MLLQVAIEYNLIQIAIQYLLSNFNLLKVTLLNLRLTYYKSGQEKMYFQKPGIKYEKPGRNSENQEKLSKKSMATLSLSPL